MLTCYRNHSAKRTNVKAENKMEKTEQMMEFRSPCECNVHTENWDVSLFLKILKQILHVCHVTCLCKTCVKMN